MNFKPLKDTTNRHHSVESQRDYRITNYSFDDIVVPTIFRNKIISHILKNATPRLASALFLGVQGAPGEGKSFQTRATLAQAKVETFHISGSQLSGRHEGDSIDSIKNCYQKASENVIKSGNETCIVIDDLDLSVVSTMKQREYTVNSQLLCGFLMNLSDNPNLCGGMRTRRIPIICTGNDFTALYAPLVRHGRFDIFDWNPTVEFKIQVAKNILTGFVEGIANAKFDAFVSAYAKMPISFFSGLRSDIVELWISTVIDNLEAVDLAAARRALQNLEAPVPLSKLHDLAAMRKKTRPLDYIGGNKRW